MRTWHPLRVAALLAGLIALMAVVVSGAMANSLDAVWPEAPGTDVMTNGKLVIDASHSMQGYVMARVSSATGHGMKLRVTFNGGQLMYDLDNTGVYEAFPLQLGSGTYQFELFESAGGSKYSAEGKISLPVQLNDPDAAYLVPNQYVNYNLLTAAVNKSDELCAGATPAEAYRIITDFMGSEFGYDFVRAGQVQAGQLPDIDYCYTNRMGICQDLSAVTVCMLRVQGIPSRLVIGYADQYYHAWTTTVVDGQEIFFDPTAAVGALFGISNYKTERIY